MVERAPDAVRATPLRRGGVGALLLLAACGGEIPPTVPAGRAVPVPAASPSPASVGPPDPCAALGRIVDAEAEGFLGLRRRLEGEGRWRGGIVPAGFADCWIEDLTAVGPHYLCRGQRFASQPEAIAADHLTLLAELDSCFVRPIWFPLTWQRGQDQSRPDGARRSSWQGGAVGPLVAMALAPHPDRPLWWNLLVVGPRAAPP